jgi:hypothetical protein
MSDPQEFVSMQGQPRSGCVGWVVLYNDESHFVIPPGHTPAVGDRMEVVRGNGPREGDRMGVATIAAFEDGTPVLRIDFDRAANDAPMGEA